MALDVSSVRSAEIAAAAARHPSMSPTPSFFVAQSLIDIKQHSPLLPLPPTPPQLRYRKPASEKDKQDALTCVKAAQQALRHTLTVPVILVAKESLPRPSTPRPREKNPFHSFDAKTPDGKCVTFTVDTYYKPVKFLGRGHYGAVMEFTDDRSKENVAIKKLNVENEVRSAFREILFMDRLRHPCILAMRDIIPTAPGKNELYMVTDLMTMTLDDALRRKRVKQEPCKWTYQILCGLKYMHAANVAHRDIKPPNILLDALGNAYLGDLGLARVLSKGVNTLTGDAELTDYTMTRWYRAPEVLLAFQSDATGSINYSTQVDIWSVGCLLLEMIDGVNNFPFCGDNTWNQVQLIMEWCGSATSNVVNMFASPIMKQWLKTCNKFPMRNWNAFEAKHGKPVTDVIRGMLRINPHERLTAEDALKLPYFDSVRNKNLESKQPKEQYTFNEELHWPLKHKLNLWQEQIWRRIVRARPWLQKDYEEWFAKTLTWVSPKKRAWHFEAHERRLVCETASLKATECEEPVALKLADASHTKTVADKIHPLSVLSISSADSD
jgi:serine/threonine protein kinase